jgi:pimeloyl-ACP methyl ester carboxylesterase
VTGYLVRDPSPVGHWRSDQGRQAYADSYAAALARLPAPSRTRDVVTEFGTVRVYEFASESTRGATPVVLLPGRSSGVPMWADNLPGFAARRPVYAFDALGDAGMTVQTRRLRDSADQAAWIDQVLAALGPAMVHLVGHSFGGWSAANYAVHHPERVASLSLIEPVFVFQRLRWQFYLRSIPVTVPLFPGSWRDRALGEIGGASTIDHQDPVTRMISDATEYYASRLPMPTRITQQQLRSLPMPVYAAMAADSSLHDSAAAVRVAEASVRDVRVRSWPGATHSLPMEFPAEIDREILAFMADHDLR